jgi:hypothetical protein
MSRFECDPGGVAYVALQLFVLQDAYLFSWVNVPVKQICPGWLLNSTGFLVKPDIPEPARSDMGNNKFLSGYSALVVPKFGRKL